MACDVLTSLCGTIGPLSICQLINFNFAMLPHLPTIHAARCLPGECARKLFGAIAYCWDAASIHPSSLPIGILLSLISYHRFQGSGGCSFWERPFLLEALILAQNSPVWTPQGQGCARPEKMTLPANEVKLLSPVLPGSPSVPRRKCPAWAGRRWGL